MVSLAGNCGLEMWNLILKRREEKKASHELYKAARTMNDIETLTSGR